MGLDSGGNPVSYNIQIVGETDAAQGTITIPAKLDNFDVIYFVGATVAPRVSYYIDPSGVYHEFSAKTTPISNFWFDSQWGGIVVIDNVSVLKESITELYFGDDYASITAAGDEFMVQYPVRKLTIPLGLKSAGSYFIGGCYYLQTLQIRNFDVSQISVGDDAFYSMEYTHGAIHADTQALGEAFRAKFPPLSNWSIVVNP